MNTKNKLENPSADTMTLRDYFAAKALLSMLSEPQKIDSRLKQREL